MKVKSAIKRICGFCQIIRRGKVLYVRCQKNNRHKQRQGFHTLDSRFKIRDLTHCQCSSGSASAMITMDSDLGLPVLSEVSHNDSCNNSKDDLDRALDEIKNKLI